MSSSSTGSTTPSDSPDGVRTGNAAPLRASTGPSLTGFSSAAANAIQPAPSCNLPLAESDSASSAPSSPSGSLPVNLHPGDTIHLTDDGSLHLPGTSTSDESLYQVIALDAGHDRCWIRSWPLTRQGSPVFEISLQQAQRHGAQRPVLQGQTP